MQAWYNLGLVALLFYGIITIIIIINYNLSFFFFFSEIPDVVCLTDDEAEDSDVVLTGEL